MNILRAVFGVFVFFIAPFAYAELQQYKLDPNHSCVTWHVSHFGFSQPSGKWLVNGTVSLDEAKPQESKVDVVIQVGELVTGIPKFDAHLKSKDFFDAAQFPTATFVSDKVNMTGKNKAKVHGILTLHGVSKPVTLNVALNKLDTSPISNKKTAGFTASTVIKRSDFGMNKYLPGVGDSVKIDIEAEAVAES